MDNSRSQHQSSDDQAQEARSETNPRRQTNSSGAKRAQAWLPPCPAGPVPGSSKDGCAGPIRSGGKASVTTDLRRKKTKSCCTVVIAIGEEWNENV